MHRIYSVALACAAAACGGSQPPVIRSADSLAAGAAEPTTGTLTACRDAIGRDSLCFRAARVHDFARDGAPFTIAIDARGPSPDSMRVALRITRHDTVFYRADWSTALYGSYDERPAPPDSARRRTVSHLARLLADSAFRPARAFLVGASSVDAALRESVEFDVAVDAERARRHLTPADTLPMNARESPPPAKDSARVSALVAELRDAPAFRYYAGGEASYVIAWSAAERRFVVVFACC